MITKDRFSTGSGSASLDTAHHHGRILVLRAGRVFEIIRL